MSPKEKKQLSALLSEATKKILDEQSKAHGFTRTQYLERLIEGTLPNRLEEKIENLRLEIEGLRNEVMNR
jgi:hypothetical protein